MQIHTTAPVPEIARAGELFAELEAAGYDGANTYETRSDPFLPLALAVQSTSKMRLGTALAIGFARYPMLLATTARDLQDLAPGGFTLGLGSQIRPHITKRYPMPWSAPAARMREDPRGSRRAAHGRSGRRGGQRVEPTPSPVAVRPKNWCSRIWKMHAPATGSKWTWS